MSAPQGYDQPGKPMQSRGHDLIVSSPPYVRERVYPAPPADIAFRGVFGDLVEAVDQHTEADRAAILVQSLVAFGSVIGRTAHFVAESTAHHLNMFAVLVGQTSKGRKGTSWGHIARLMNEVDSSWQTANGLSTGEGLIWHVRDAVYGPLSRKGADPTEEAVLDPGVKDKRLCLVEPEFAKVLRMAERDGSSLSAIVREAWDSGDLRSMTKNSPMRATDAHISLIGHVTADELRRSLTATDTANGFANRFLWVCVRRSKLLPDGGAFKMPPHLVAAWRDAVAFARSVATMRRDDAAGELWRLRYPDLSEGRPGMLGSITGRAEAQTMRLACLFALGDCSSAIGREHLEAALAVWEYCHRSAEYVFGDSLGDPVSDELLARLREAGAAGLTRAGINNDVFGRNKSSFHIQRALDVLAEHRLASCRFQRDRGRAIEHWFATPRTAN